MTSSGESVPGAAEIGAASMAVYQFIIDYKVANDGNSPSRRQIADGVKRGESTVQWHIVRLARAGLLSTGPVGSRDISIPGAVWTPPEVGR